MTPAPAHDHFRPLTDLLLEQVATRRQQPALICWDTTWTHGELNQHVERAAAWLQARNVGPGDAVAICALPSAHYCAVFLGALRAGAVVVPLPLTGTAEQLAAMVTDSGARWAFTDTQGATLLKGVAAAVVALPEVALDAAAAPVDIEPEWPFNIIYSSGTTGVPKGIAQSHLRRWQHVQAIARLGCGGDTVALLSTPLYSNTTLVMLFPVLALGGTVVLMPKFDAEQYLALAQRYRVTHAMLVPVQVQRILTVPSFGQFDLSSFRLKVCTGAPFAPALKEQALARWPGGLVELYGLTEGAGSCMLVAHDHPDKLHTVGRPTGGSDIRIVDAQGNEAPQGTSGEVVGRAPGMMDTYHNHAAPAEDSEWFDAHGRRYLRTGDIGHFDADGFLVLVDRKKDVIISGGFNIYSVDLESHLCGHPAVAEAAVVGVPSARWGETPIAVVVLKPGQACSADELLRWLNERVGKTQRLSALHLTGELPRNAGGKVLKRSLREQYAGA